MSVDELLTIDKVTLKNFASYESAELDCSNNLTILYGPDNGSGKSTFAEALSKLLTNNYIANVSDNDKIRHGSESFVISASGNFHKEPIEIICEKTPSKARIQLTHGDRIYDGREATEFLSNITNADEFRRLVYINGTDIEILIQGTPDARAKIFDRIFGIQSLITVIDNLKVKPLTDKITVLSIELNKKLGEKSSIEKILKEIINKDEIVSEIEQREKKKGELLLEIGEIQANVTLFQKELTEYNVNKNRLQQVKRNIATLENKRDSLQLNYNNLVSLDKRLLVQIKKTIKSNKDIETYLSRVDNMIMSLYTTITELQTKDVIDAVASIRLSLLTENTENDVCPVCETKIDKAKLKLIADKNAATRNGNFKNLEALKKKRNGLIAEKQNVEECRMKREAIQKRIEDEKIKLNKVDDEIAREKTMLFSMNEFDTVAFNEKKLQMRIKNDQLQENENQLHNLKRKLETAENNELRNKTLLIIDDEIKTIRKDIKVLEYKVGKINEYREGLKNILNNVRFEITQTLNPIIQRWINVFVPPSSDIPYLSYQLNAKEHITDKVHRIRYEDTACRYGVSTSFNNLSTGQRAICALSLILAVNEIGMHKMNLMIFDELHTSGIDDRGLAEILKLLIRFSSQFRVMFIERRKDIIDYIQTEADLKNVSYTLYNITAIEGVSYVSREKQT